MRDKDESESVAPSAVPLIESSSSMCPRPSKLVVISTGLWGALWNVEFMRERLQEAGGADVLVYCAASNVMLNSYSGIDVCGKRLAAEVGSLFSKRSDLDQVRSISFIGYSAGGLFVRYAVGVLHDEGLFSKKGIILDKVISVATPHLGVRSSPRVRMGRLKNGLLGVLGNAYGGRSLEQMALADSHAPDGNPLVLHMSLPGTRYTDALKACKGVFFYANAWNDNTVSYCTAAVAKTNQYRHLTNAPQLEGFPFIAGVFPISDDQDLQRHGESNISGYARAPLRASGTAIEPADERPARGPESPEIPAVRNDMPMASSGVGTAAAAMVIAPILVVQFVLLIFPLRIAHSVCTDDEFKHKTAESTNSDDKNCSRVKGETPSPDENPLLEDGPERSIDPSGELGNSEAKMMVKADVLKGEVDGVPAAIRRNLARPDLGIRRVDVCLPGLHTHGSIVVRRRRVNQDGKVVIAHMASLLLV